MSEKYRVKEIPCQRANLLLEMETLCKLEKLTLYLAYLA